MKLSTNAHNRRQRVKRDMKDQGRWVWSLGWISTAVVEMNGCEMRTIEREGRGEEMLLPRVNGEWTEDLSRKVRRARSSILLEISSAYIPSLGDVDRPVTNAVHLVRMK